MSATASPLVVCVRCTTGAHSDCATVSGAHATCICGTGPWSNRDYGKCATCGHFKAWRKGPNPDHDDFTRALRTIPARTRDRDAYDRAVKMLTDAGVTP